MNEPRFTKGQWRIVDSPKGISREIRAGEIPICSMAMTDFYGVPEEEKMANALLLKKAPYMYHLLNEIAEQRISGLTMYAAINTLLAQIRGEVQE